MKYVSNTTKNPISYKDKIIPPGASVMLNNKGEIVDEVTDNTEEIEKLKGAVSKAVTLAQVDTRLEEVECRITNLVTSANSKQDFDISVDLEDVANKVDWSTNCITDRVYKSYSGCWCVPIDLSKSLKPGIYVNDPLSSVNLRKVIQFEIPVKNQVNGDVYNSAIGVHVGAAICGEDAPKQISCGIYELSNAKTNFVLDIFFYKRGVWVMDNPRDRGTSSFRSGKYSTLPADPDAGIKCWVSGNDFSCCLSKQVTIVKCTLANGEELTNAAIGKAIIEKLKSRTFTTDSTQRVVRLQ